MNSTPSAVRRTQTLVALLVAAALALVGLSLAPAPAAHAVGGTNPVRIFIEKGAANYGTDPSTQVTDAGWWAHEGPSRSALESSVSTDLSDNGGDPTPASQTAWLTALGLDAGDYASVDDAFTNHIGIAFVPTSADGSTEQPDVTAGESALDAFEWVTDLAFPATLSATTDLSDVYPISTKAELDAWVADGKPDQQADANLVYHDLFRAGSPVSVAPKGKSILNRWPAGTHVSLVVFQYDSRDANGIPIIGAKSIKGGRAVTAWMKFTTVANPARTVATSGGYQLANDVVTPTVSLTSSWPTGAASGTLTAALTGPGGGALTDATGTIQFTALPKNASAGTFTNYGAPVAVSATGTAKVTVTGLSAGDIQKFQATYTPDGAASGTYAGATSGTKTVIAPALATPTIKTALKPKRVHAGDKAKLTVTVTATGATPSGTVKVKYDPAKGRTKTLKATLTAGKAVIVLPKAVKGTTKLTITYSGDAAVAKGTKSVSYKVRA